MNLRPKTVTFLLTFLCWTAFAPAQDPVDCLTFEDLPAEEQFGPQFGQKAGDTILTSEELAVTLDSFFYSNGTGDLVQVSVFTDEGLSGDYGQLLFPSNASLTFRPTHDEALLSSLCFDFFYYGGSINLGVNGQQRLIFENLNDLLDLADSEPFPNVALSIDLAPTDGFPIQGTLCVKGDLESLTIGGQEFALDNVCPETRSTEPCDWDEVSVTPVSCSEEGIINLKVVFPANWPEQDEGYFATVEGKTFGPFRYADTLIVVGPVPVNDADLYEVILFDANESGCRFRDFFRLPCVNRPCPVTEIEAYIDECSITTDPLSSEIVVNFDPNSDLALKFLLEIGGVIRDTFSTDQLPLRIRVPFVVPLEAPIMTSICLDVPGFSTPCCFELTLTRKNCGPVNTCIAFEELESDAIYGKDSSSSAGRVIFIEDRVPVGIDSFVFEDGNKFYGSTQVTTDLFGGGFRRASGQYLFASNNNLTFYLSRTQKPINQVCFDFIEGGGSLNLGVNGYPVKVLSTFGEAADVDWPDGITATVEYDTTAGTLRQGTLCLAGDIQQLTVGGQELGLDNVCFAHKPEDICRISGLEAIPTACGADGLFYVDLMFDQSGPSGEGFHVFRSNGQSIGTFSYEDDSVRVGPFNAYSRDLLYLIVQDKRFPNCADKVLVDKPTDCMNDCGLGGLQVDILNCYDQLFYDLKIDLRYWPDSNADGRFRLLIEGRDFGTYAYSDLPLELGQVDILTEATTFPVEICHLGPDNSTTEQCCIRATVDKKECLQPCDLGELEIVEKQCDNNGGLYVALDFEHQNTSDYFVLARNGVPVGKYRYSELPIKAGPFYPSLTDRALKLSVYDVRSPRCNSSVLIDPFPCEPGPCELGEIKIIDKYCDANGQAILVVDFDHARTSGKFVLTLNNREVGTYSYRELPIKVGPFGPVDANVVSLAAFDAEDPDCRTEIRFEDFPCEPVPCELGEIRVLERLCTDAGERYVKLDFRYQGTSDSFYLFLNDELVRRYNYKHLPIKVKLPATAADATFRIIAVDAGPRDACATDLNIEAFPCEPVPCELSEIRVLDRYCDDSGQRYVKLDFEYAGVSDSFYLYQNNQLVARYNYHHLPIKVELDPTSNTARTLLTVVDTKSEDCAAETIIDAFPCEPNDCHLGPIEIVDRSCEDGVLYLGIDFRYEGVSESFVLLQNGNEIGTYRYDQLPIKVGPYYPPIEPGAIVLKAVDSEDPDCRTDLRLPALFCTDDCDLGPLKLEQTECDAAGTYFVTLHFDYPDANGRFRLIQNGDTLGQFAYAELPIRLGPFDEPKPNGLLVKVQDLTDENCVQNGFINDLGCKADPCVLYDLKTDDFECLEDGTYRMTLSYRSEGLREDQVLVATFSSGYQFRFKAGENPIRITGIPLPDARQDVVTLCAANGPESCCITIDYDVPCRNICGLSNLEVKAGDCDAEGRFDLKVDIDYMDVSDGFTLFLNGRAYGNYMYDELPIRVGNLSGGPGKVYQVTVRDFRNFECKISTRIESPACVAPCGLADVKVRVGSCEDGFFKALIYPEMNDNREGSFLVFVGGELFGPYKYGTEEVAVGPFPANGQRYDVLVVDLDDPTCFAHSEINAPENCTEPDDCVIEDLKIRVLECNPDGSYLVGIDFEAKGADDAFFDLLNANGEVLGYYRIDELPLRINLELPADSTVTLGVCINDRPDCCARVEVEVPDCSPEANCFLDRIKVSTTECDSNGQVFIILESGLEASSNVAIEVIINDRIVDSIRFDASGTVRLGPIDPSIGKELFVLLGSLTSNDCFREIALRFPECADESDVWPGDANKDNIANYIDLINVGVAYGSRGLARAERTTDWASIPGSAWSQFFANGLNYKHADCNGDGIVDARDIGIILANYNKTNGQVEIPDTLPATDLDPPIRLELPPGGHMGSTDPRLNIPIILGDAERPVEDIYGLAFVIEFNPEHINPATIDVEILTSWMGVPGVNLAGVDYTDARNGRIEIAISRTDQNEVSGYGPIAMLRGIKDDIAGIRTEIYLRHGRRTRIDLEEEGIGGGDFELSFTDPVTDPGLVDLRNSLSVYPNPSSDMVRVVTSLEVPIEEIQVIGTDGRTLTGVVRNSEWISIKDLPEGIYVLRVKVGNHIIHKKVIRE